MNKREMIEVYGQKRTLEILNHVSSNNLHIAFNTTSNLIDYDEVEISRINDKIEEDLRFN
jgi:hypothetical protein